MESVLERIKKRGNARKDHVQHGVHGVTGQAVLLHVGRESGTESGNVDPQQGEIIQKIETINVLHRLFQLLRELSRCLIGGRGL